MIRRFAVPLSALALMGCAGAPPPPRTPDPPRELDVPVGGFSLHVWTFGGGASDARTMLVLHGGPGVSHDYLEPLASLADEHLRVVFYDQRGVGRSGGPPRDAKGEIDPAGYGRAQYVADAEAVRAAVGAPEVILLGHSWGGLVAEWYLDGHEGAVSALVLVDAAPPTSASFYAGAERFGARLRALVARGIVPKTRPHAVGDDCTESFRPLGPVYFADPRDPRANDFGRMTCKQGINEATLDQLGDFDLTKVLAAFRRPSLVVFGAADPFGVAWADEEARALGTREVVIPGAGHFPWVERPDAFFREVRALLESVRG